MIDHQITHPRMGYKIATAPHDLRGATVGTELTYTHEHLDGPQARRVIALSKSSTGTRKYLIVLDESEGLLWAIHPHYHTGIDLAVIDADGVWQAAPDLAGVSAALGREVGPADIQDLIDRRIIRPEDELPGKAFGSPEQRASMDRIAQASAPYLRMLAGDIDDIQAQ